jgi:uncharacterized OB-fold protein
VSATPVDRRLVTEGLFTVRGDGTIALLGGYSPTSARYHFPRLPACPYTGADDVEAVELSADATLWGWTAVTAPPPGYEGDVPFGFGVVELVREQLRVITRLTVADPAALTFGQPMHLVADTLHTDADGTDVLTYAFAPGPSKREVRP